MKLLIPKNLPQFSDSPALFLSVGLYEAHFYLAHHGMLEGLESFKIPLTSKDLIRKFYLRVSYAIHSLMDEYQFGSIYLFAPSSIAKRVVKGLEPNEEEKIKIKFFGQYAELHPLELLKIFWKQIDLLISSSISPPVSLKIKKIIDRSSLRHPAIQKIKT